MGKALKNGGILAFILAGLWLIPWGRAWGENLMTVDCPGQLIFSRESDNSRSGICIRLDKESSACRIKGIVGGEHISYVGVRGRKGSWYRILFTPVQGSPGYMLHWPEGGAIVSDQEDGSEIIGPIDTRGFILALSAHPFGEYSLSIRLVAAPINPFPGKVPFPQ